MTTYKVRLVQQVLEEAWIEVDANSESEAGDVALTHAPHDAEWSFLETCDHYPMEVTTVEIVAETTERR
jgi:hypothetical protein